MDKNKMSAILALVTPTIIQLIMDERGLDCVQAANMLYGSKLYETLEIPETGLWRLSAATLYALLCQELHTGSIIFPEEQA